MQMFDAPEYAPCDECGRMVRHLWKFSTIGVLGMEYMMICYDCYRTLSQSNYKYCDECGTTYHPDDTCWCERK
jgi:hypothetical protein